MKILLTILMICWLSVSIDKPLILDFCIVVQV